MSDADRITELESQLTALHEERDRLRKAEQLIADVLSDYGDELDKAACDRCEQCGAVAMCSFHSVLSALQRHTWTAAALERQRLHEEQARLKKELESLKLDKSFWQTMTASDRAEKAKAEVAALHEERRSLLADVSALREELAKVKAEAITCAVSEIRQGEENDGQLESTDLYIRGRGLSLLVNVTVEGEATYTFIADGQERQSGTLREPDAPLATSEGT